MDKTIPILLGGIGVVGAAFGYAYYVNQQKITPPTISTTSKSSTSTTGIFPTVIELTASTTQTQQGVPITFSASVTQDNLPVLGALVKFTGLGTPILSSTNVLGVAKKTVTIKTPGKYTITAQYGSETQAINIIITRVNTVKNVFLTSNGTAVLSGGSISFYTFVSNTYNTPLPSIPVTLYVDSVVYSTTNTNAVGLSTTTITFTSLGQHEVYTEAAGIETTNPLNVGVNASYAIALSVSTTGAFTSSTSLTQQMGGNVFAVARVTGEQNGGNVANVPVTFTDNLTNMGVVNTGNTGYAIIQVGFSSAGKYIIAGEVLRGNTQLSSTATAEVTIVNNYKASILPVNKQINAGTSITFAFSLFNGLNPVSGAKYTIFNNGTQIAAGITNSSGSGSQAISFPSTGIFDIAVIFYTGSGEHKAIATIDVIKPTTPPPSSYTCYNGRCKSVRLSTGQTETYCQAASYTSSTPCPSGHATASEACNGVVC